MKQRIERSIVYIAEVEGRVVVFANYSTVRDGGKVELAAIYLYPVFQGKGIGIDMIQQAVKELKGIKIKIKITWLISKKGCVIYESLFNCCNG